MQTVMDYLEEILDMGAEVGVFGEHERMIIVKYLAEPAVSVQMVVRANMHAAQLRTSLIYFPLGNTNEYWGRKRVAD
tara:strand:+ start:85 stop:315 length:231 start_codon:yes stop_codon:yes gene_type:complete